MPRTIVVHRLAEDGLKVKEISPEEANRLIQEAYTRGNTVVDKATDDVIDDITREAKGIILVATLSRLREVSAI